MNVYTKKRAYGLFAFRNIVSSRKHSLWVCLSETCFSGNSKLLREISYLSGRRDRAGVHPAAQTKLCLSCKREALSSWKYCIYCGALLVKACLTCGYPHIEVEGARYCFACGSAWRSVEVTNVKGAAKTCRERRICL